MSETPHMIVKSKSYDYENGNSSLLSGLLTIAVPFVAIGPFVTTNTIPELAFLGLIGTATVFPWVTKLISGADARTYNDELRGLSKRQAGPTFREKRELVSKDETTGEEVYLTRNFKHAIIETHTPEKPGKTWDRVYESLLKVHDLKETDFLVYAEAPEESDSTHGKLLPWKHSINKAMAFTGYELSCDCRSCAL